MSKIVRALPLLFLLLVLSAPREFYAVDVIAPSHRVRYRISSCADRRKKKRSSSLKKYDERESERERGIERDTRGIAKYFAILHRLSPTFVSYITITLSTDRFYIILKRSRLRLVIPKQSVIFVSTRYLSI